MNSATVSGYVSNEPILTGKENNGCVKFVLAVKKEFIKKGDNQDAYLLNVVAFGKRAEFIYKSIKKGQPVLVVGYNSCSSYMKDGKVNYSYDIVAKRIEFIEKGCCCCERNASNK